MNLISMKEGRLEYKVVTIRSDSGEVEWIEFGVSPEGFYLEEKKGVPGVRMFFEYYMNNEEAVFRSNTEVRFSLYGTVYFQGSVESVKNYIDGSVFKTRVVAVSEQKEAVTIPD